MQKLLLLASAIASGILPEPLRAKRTGLPSAAASALSGLVEIALAGPLFLWAYPRYFDRVAGAAHEALGAMAMNSEMMPGNGVFMVMGFSTYLGFLFASPFGWVVLLLFGEGLLRIAAGMAGIPLGSAFVAVPYYSWQRIRSEHRRRVPRPFLADRVTIEPTTHGLLIDCTADKRLVRDHTVRYDGRRYRLVGRRYDEALERPYQYRFELAPAWWSEEGEEFEPLRVRPNRRRRAREI